MAELCVMCDKNYGKKISEGKIIVSGDEFYLIICDVCLIKEIEFFIKDIGGDDSSYDGSYVDDPFFMIENDAYLNQKITNRLRLKIYNKAK